MSVALRGEDSCAAFFSRRVMYVQQAEQMSRERHVARERGEAAPMRQIYTTSEHHFFKARVVSTSAVNEWAR
jgi:hypothetical protein